MRGFENSVRTAEKGRALGLGVLGWHTYLQQRGIAFEGLQAQFETRNIFSQIKIESERASRALAEAYGEPLWCRDTGMRNTHLRAVAPTVSNSKLAGGVSAGIEPIPANVWTDQSAKGTFIRKNSVLENYLSVIGHDNKKVWDKILADGGSIQDLKFLDECKHLCKNDTLVVFYYYPHNSETEYNDQNQTLFNVKEFTFTEEDVKSLPLFYGILAEHLYPIEDIQSANLSIEARTYKDIRYTVFDGEKFVKPSFTL
jgi:hypothetical protein